MKWAVSTEEICKMKYPSPLFLMLIGLMVCWASCKETTDDMTGQPPVHPELIEFVNLPEDFRIHSFAEAVEGARSVVVSDSGWVFVGTRAAGKVYALKDLDGDLQSDTMITLVEGLQQPNGVALYHDDLYIAEISKVWRIPDIAHKIPEQWNVELVYDALPTETHHGWRYIKFGPDEKLYIAIGAPCNVCLESDERFATICRMNPDGSEFEVVHSGIRNSVGFDWHPESCYLWFTDNGRDWLGDDLPACELNVARNDQQHYGFPFCHQGDLPDPDFGSQADCDQFSPPALKLGPHVAPLGLTFLYKAQVPTSYKDKVLIAEHGSWNRSTPIGYRLSMTSVDSTEAGTYEIFADGWLDGTDKKGRPVDLELYTDGSILLTDDFAHRVYRIYYED